MINITEKQYNNLVSYAKIITSKSPHITPDDLVNDALLQIIEKGVEYNEGQIKHLINNFHLDKKLNERSLKNDKKFSVFETDRHCKKCNQVLPIAMFRLLTNKYGVQFIQSYCKKCQNAYSCSIAKKKRAIDPIRKEAYNKRIARWRKLNPKKWAETLLKSKQKRLECSKNWYKEKSKDPAWIMARNKRRRALANKKVQP